MSTAQWMKEYLREKSEELQLGEVALMQQAEQLNNESRENMNWFERQEEIKLCEYECDFEDAHSDEITLLSNAYDIVVYDGENIDFLRDTIKDLSKIFDVNRKAEILAMSDKRLLKKISSIIEAN